ncbi:MAG: ExeM/NucH family extracellular endonuclease [Pseudomonadota bacterium]
MTAPYPLRHSLRAALFGGSVLLGLPLLAAAELGISEYLEGSGNNKALELHNPGTESLDLGRYRLEFYFNGSAVNGRSIALQGSLAAGGVFVLAHGAAAPALLALADQRLEGSWFNGNDAIVLRDNEGRVLDSIGQVGVDPGAAWGSGDIQTLDRTLRRSNPAAAGDGEPGDAFDPSLAWQGYPRDSFDNIGRLGAAPPDNGNAGSKRIHEVQGDGASSPLVGQQVSVEALVVADFQDASQLKGFFVQTPDDQVDADPLTSEGLFVYDGGTGVAVQLGDRLQVSGEVREFNGLTQLAGALEVRVLARDQALPAAAAVQLPLPSADYLERHEGMAVFLPQPLTVTEVYNLGRYGEVLLSSGGRLMIPTNQVLPGAPALALQARNALNQLLLDDGRSGQNPDPIRYPAPELSAFDSLRVGNQANGIRGVLDYAAGRYRVQPLATPDFLPSNPRPAEPQNLEGQVRVASFNVLNYFNGDGLGGGFPTSRGAHTAEEFQRQRAKLIAAILASRADVVGLMEIENDGYAPTSAIADLVAGLNAALPRGQRFAFVNPGVDRLGSDEIAVGLIYRRDRILPHKASAILDSQVDPRFDDSKNRPALAQTFRQRDSGERLTLVVNHLKSKGSSCAEAGDPDRGDGQGHCNLTRARAAQALVEWLATDPTRSRDPDYLILGDLNAYAQEDPIALIRAAGYSDLVARFAEAGQGYSYVFDGQSGYLDHGLASASLLPQVRGALAWHINADEPRVLDYNTEFKTARQQALLYSAEPYRGSDHDPLVIGIDLQRR